MTQYGVYECSGCYHKCCIKIPDGFNPPGGDTSKTTIRCILLKSRTANFIHLYDEEV